MEPWPSDVQLFQPYEVTDKRDTSVFYPKASSLGVQIALLIATDLNVNLRLLIGEVAFQHQK